MFYERTVLDNGITVLSEKMDSVHSATVGLWFAVGSRDETPEEAGLSHLLEHMMFKGTKKRTASDISQAFDAMGAEFNAFTSKEYTCYYARFVDTHLTNAVDLLSDMVVNSKFADDMLETERNVVIEEMKRYEDSYDDHVTELASAARFPTHPLGRQIIGTQEVISGVDREMCHEYHKRFYTTGNMIVAAAGNVDHDELVALVERLFVDMPQGERNVRPEFTEGDPVSRTYLQKVTEQAHIAIDLPGIGVGDERRFAASTLNTILGGGMSSRLFQEVREKRGLVYAIYSYPSSFQGAGETTIYAGTRPDNITEILSVVKQEIAKLRDEGVTEDELKRTKDYLIGRYTLSLESSQSRMVSLGRQETVGSEILSFEETVQRYRDLTVDDLAAVAQDLYADEPLVAVISPYEDAELSELVEEGMR